jgi:hypothetical protein
MKKYSLPELLLLKKASVLLFSPMMMMMMTIHQRIPPWKKERYTFSQNLSSSPQKKKTMMKNEYHRCR